MMKRKLILTGAALSLAVAMTGCGGKPVINQQPSSQAQLISMEAAQEVALKAANIAAEDAAISATTLNEVAGTSCYKVEFTSGDYAYAYTVNAETGAVMEMSSREKNAVDTGGDSLRCRFCHNSEFCRSYRADGNGHSG